jgi:hypothetical protein
MTPNNVRMTTRVSWSSVVALALLSVASVTSAQSVCNEGTPCQLAGLVVTHALERFPLEGRNVFVDVESFQRMARSLAGDLTQQELAAAVSRPFRADVENTERVRPGAGFTPRWANDPFVISVDSVRVQDGQVDIVLRQRYNMRNPGHEHATAVFSEMSKWKYVLRREGGVWRILSHERLTLPF